MISVSGKHWEEIKSNKRIIDKIKIDHSLNDIQSKIVLTKFKRLFNGMSTFKNKYQK